MPWSLDSGFEAKRRLAEAHIICNKMPLPGDSWIERSGLWLGINEVTRRGIKANEMKDIAGFISMVLVEEPPRIGEEVADYMKSYNKVMYCFDQADSNSTHIMKSIKRRKKTGPSGFLTKCR